jgi:hypothetical protein
MLSSSLLLSKSQRVRQQYGDAPTLGYGCSLHIIVCSSCESTYRIGMSLSRRCKVVILQNAYARRMLRTQLVDISAIAVEVYARAMLVLRLTEWARRWRGWPKWRFAAALGACRSTIDLTGSVLSVSKASRVALHRLSLWSEPSAKL